MIQIMLVQGNVNSTYVPFAHGFLTSNIRSLPNLRLDYVTMMRPSKVYPPGYHLLVAQYPIQELAPQCYWMDADQWLWALKLIWALRSLRRLHLSGHNRKMDASSRLRALTISGGSLCGLTHRPPEGAFGHSITFVSLELWHRHPSPALLEQIKLFSLLESLDLLFVYGFRARVQPTVQKILTPVIDSVHATDTLRTITITVMRRSAESDGFDTSPSRADFLNDLKTSRMEDKLDRFTGLTSVKLVIQEE
ncbi:hypothetical protein C8Q76DRAFT_861946 [Earliella scabrosa]|nr:hypothetical protein C8Q76DRAFT_861946 [Earliella scabrosa]